jgi:DegV family protein with EDD domain
VTIRIVTDSTADLPDTLASELDVTVVPLHVYFGDEHFSDGLTITKDEFYRRLATPGQLFPRTSAPSTGEFASAYERVSAEADAIVSIHLSPRLSATYASASAACTAVRHRCRIEMIDSASASLALGLLVIQAAMLARGGARLEEIVHATLTSVPRTRFFGVLDTLEYLRRGGRIGKATALLGSLLNTKPLVGLRDGVAYPIERVRGRQRSLNRIVEIVKEYRKPAFLAVGHTTDLDGMRSLASRLSDYFPCDRMVQAQCGAALGSYLGPGAYGVALIESAT